MTVQEIYQELKKHAANFSLELVGTKNPFTPGQTEPAGDPYILVPRESLNAICKMLKMTELFHFDCLTNLTGADWKDRFEVVYHLFSYRHRHLLQLKVSLPHENPSLSTVEGIWKTANWLEREVYDLLGIHFEGHSDLRRIMLPEDWIGHPLRKDYKEEAEYHGIGTTRPSLL